MLNRERRTILEFAKPDRPLKQSSSLQRAVEAPAAEALALQWA